MLLHCMSKAINMSKRRCWRNLSQVLEKQLFWSKLIEEKVVRCNFKPKITLCFKSPKCLRFYVHWFFIERLPISNFLICLINWIILLKWAFMNNGRNCRNSANLSTEIWYLGVRGTHGRWLMAYIVWFSTESLLS